jgi:hypothetical protein
MGFCNSMSPRFNLTHRKPLTLSFYSNSAVPYSVAMHYAYYNFVKSNIAIRCTPAMAAVVTSTFWTVRDLVEMVEA